jgi:predicted nucleotidyltransferase
MPNKEEILDLLKKEFKLHPLRVLNIYPFGSRCYDTATENSDYDFIVIAKSSVENVEHTIGDYNFHIQTEDYFKERLDWNDPKSFECILWKRPLMETRKFSLMVDPPKFRHAVSHISSNSWVKAKKKIYQGDIYIGQKSLFHSLRIPMFAIQIMINGDIYDWECANMYWEDIKQIKGWDILKKKYQPIRNEIMSDFRKLCSK